MNVLVCPVCQGTMREISRQGVMIDTCTQCRGVWLDRGELEKLSAIVGEEPRRGGGFLPTAAGGRMADRDRPPQPYRRDDDDDDDDDRRRYGSDRRRPGMGRFLDFFD